MTEQIVTPFALTGLDDMANPYPRYRDYREIDPVHVVRAFGGGADTYYLFRYDDVSHVLASHHFGRSAQVALTVNGAPPVKIPDRFTALREIVDNWLVFLDPPRHTTLRSTVIKHFTGRVVASMRPRITALATQLLVELRNSSPSDLVAHYAAPLPILVILEVLGVPSIERHWMRACAVALQEANSSRGGDREVRLARADDAAVQLREYFRAEVRRRRHQDLDDLMSALVRAGGVDGSLTDLEIISTCIHLMTAGHETTTNFISKAMLALLSHPDALRELRAAPDLMPAAVEELIRYDPPVQMISRWAYQGDIVGGRAVRPGSKVTLVLGSANRDPSRYPSPETLDFRRRSVRHLGFGGGIHYCLGAGLARLEGEIALLALINGAPDLRVASEHIPYADDLVFHGPTQMLVNLTSPPMAAAGIRRPPAGESS